MYILHYFFYNRLLRGGSREEDDVSGFFVLSHLGMKGYFRLGYVK